MPKGCWTLMQCLILQSFQLTSFLDEVSTAAHTSDANIWVIMLDACKKKQCREGFSKSKGISVFYKHNVYKHIESQISPTLGIP